MRPVHVRLDLPRHRVGLRRPFRLDRRAASALVFDFFRSAGRVGFHARIVLAVPGSAGVGGEVFRDRVRLRSELAGLGFRPAGAYASTPCSSSDF